MAMPAPLRKLFLLHSQRAAFKRQVDTALETIDAFFSNPSVCNPYVSVSGGKDSSVLLALCREVHRDVPAVFWDVQANHPETAAVLDTHVNLHRIKAQDRLQVLATQGARSNATVPARDDIASELGYDSFFYGLRAEEAAGRKQLLRARGKIFQKRNGFHVCQPLADWGYRDIWGFITSEGLPYNALYDAMWDWPAQQQRIASYACVKVMQFGTAARLKSLRPHLFNRLVAADDTFREFV